MQLLVNAIGVFNEKGVDNAVIDDLIAVAGVARGTFYNHFKTTNELLRELVTCMSDEVLGVIDPMVLQHDNPVERFASGTRLYMRLALRYPQWGHLMTQAGSRVAARGQLIDIYVTRDLRTATEGRLLRVPDVDVARDMVVGAIFYGIETMLAQPTRSSHAEHLIEHVLIGLGLSVQEAARVAHMPLHLPAKVTGPIFDNLTAASGAEGTGWRYSPS